MSHESDIRRRDLLAAAGAAASMVGFGMVESLTAAEKDQSSAPQKSGCCSTGTTRLKLVFNNADFYQDGKFQVEKAKDAVIALCQHHGYPVYPDLRDQLWVSDYNTGEFTKLGLAAYLFVNNLEDRYMLMDIYLLPGQMLPEHWHLEGEGNPAKREGWLVRSGLSHIVGIGESNLGKDVVIPRCHFNGKVTVSHETVATPGMFVKLARVESRHWQLAGPEGAIITEVANVHTNSAVRHTDPALNAFFLKS